MASLVLLLVQARGTRGSRGHCRFDIEYEILIVRDERFQWPGQLVVFMKIKIAYVTAGKSDIIVLYLKR